MPHATTQPLADETIGEVNKMLGIPLQSALVGHQREIQTP